MPVNFDLSRYVNPANALPGIDVTAGYRQWQAQHLDEQRLAEQKRQFDANETQQNSQFSQEQGLRERSANDVNARFGLQMGEQTNARGYEQQSSRYKQQQALLAKARQAGAEGRWNEVESMLGSLKELGADVSRTLDDEGKPVYHLQGGQEPTPSGETFQSALGNINSNRGSSGGYQFNPNQPQISTQPGGPASPQLRNQFDTNLGTSQHLAPTSSANPQLDSQEAQPQQQQESQGFDPYKIDSAQLQRMNDIRLKPLMAGIEGAFPNRFQPQISSLLGGMSHMGSSPEGYLEQLQKPMDTAARLMGAELNSEGQMARAGISQSGREDTLSRNLTNDGRAAARRVLQEYGVKDAVDNSMNIKKITQMIMSTDPVSNAQGIKEMVRMVEGSRITDKDFDIAKTGIASDWTKAEQRLQLIYKDGLTADQKSNFRNMADQYLQSNKSRISSGSKAVGRYINKFKSDAERYGAWNEMIGLIPDEYIPEEYRGHDPNSSLGGTRSVGSGGSKSVSATGHTTQEAVDGVDALKEFE